MGSPARRPWAEPSSPSTPTPRRAWFSLGLHPQPQCASLTSTAHPMSRCPLPSLLLITGKLLGLPAEPTAAVVVGGTVYPLDSWMRRVLPATTPPWRRPPAGLVSPLAVRVLPQSWCILLAYRRSQTPRGSVRSIAAAASVMRWCLGSLDQCRRSWRGSASTAWLTTTSRRIVARLHGALTAGVRDTTPETAPWLT